MHSFVKKKACSLLQRWWLIFWWNVSAVSERWLPLPITAVYWRWLAFEFCNPINWSVINKRKIWELRSSGFSSITRSSWASELVVFGFFIEAWYALSTLIHNQVALLILIAWIWTSLEWCIVLLSNPCTQIETMCVCYHANSFNLDNDIDGVCDLAAQWEQRQSRLAHHQHVFHANECAVAEFAQCTQWTIMAGVHCLHFISKASSPELLPKMMRSVAIRRHFRTTPRCNWR